MRLVQSVDQKGLVMPAVCRAMRWPLGRRRGVGRPSSRRRGVSSLDYMLVFGVVIPIMVGLFVVGPKLFNAAYQIMCTLISWPFM